LKNQGKQNEPQEKSNPDSELRVPIIKVAERARGGLKGRLNRRGGRATTGNRKSERGMLIKTIRWKDHAPLILKEEGDRVGSTKS